MKEGGQLIILQAFFNNETAVPIIWSDGTNWIPIDLNANILARNIYFLQIKESLTHSALVFNVHQ